MTLEALAWRHTDFLKHGAVNTVAEPKFYIPGSGQREEKCKGGAWVWMS
jgi:hypothetical protein